jgi:hypothetical protein
VGGEPRVVGGASHGIHLGLAEAGQMLHLSFIIYHLSFIIYHFFEVDIPDLKPIIYPSVYRNAQRRSRWPGFPSRKPLSGRGGRLRVPDIGASRRSALPLCPVFSPFNIQNSQFIPLFFQSGLIGLNQGKSEQKNKRIFAKNEHKVHMDNNLC